MAKYDKVGGGSYGVYKKSSSDAWVWWLVAAVVVIGITVIS